jgi:hypothetical protein
MHHPESGVDCGALFAYWLAEAKAGRMPWLKYLIWRATIYDVRHHWAPQPSAGHFDHVHLSARTDTESLHLGDWSPLPMEDGMAYFDDLDAKTEAYRVLTMLADLATNPLNNEPNELHVVLHQILTAVTAQTPVEVDAAAVAAALLADPTFLPGIAKAVNDMMSARLAP